MLRNNIYSIKIFLIILIILTILILDTSKTISANNNILDEKPIAVMIGNSPDEWAVQNGLSQADVVYEIAVEYPFTRLMAFFSGNTDTVVGPVRSSRYYFSRICAEWSAIFAHCGGRSLKNTNVWDIDEMFHPSPYWRDEKIGGWINLFTSITKINQEAKKHFNSINDNQNNHNLLNFRKLDMNNSEQICKITIKYHSDYIISYEYQPDQKKYYRYINQKPHIDQGSQEQIKVSNIIVQYIPIEKIAGDDQGRVSVELIGEGIARVFYGRTYKLVKWIKKNKDEQTLFLDKEGFPIVYNQGTTWIHLLSPDSEMWFR